MASVHERREAGPSSAQELRSNEARSSSIEASPPTACDSFFAQLGSPTESDDPSVLGCQLLEAVVPYDGYKQRALEDGALQNINAKPSTRGSNIPPARCSRSSFSSEDRYSIDEEDPSLEEQAIQAKLEEAELVGSTYVACPTPRPIAPGSLWKFRLGPYGVGYYYSNASAVKVDRMDAKVVKKTHRPTLGWGRLAYRAMVDDDGDAVRTALEKTTSGQDDIASCLASVFKGGSSFYYGDLRVRAGHDDCPLVPEPGDTLLHMAIRHKRSTTFIATLLDLGADRTAVNKAGETPTDIDPLAIYRADEYLRDLRGTLQRTTENQKDPTADESIR